MKQYRFTTTYKKLLADTVTPVSIYLKLRDRFVNTLLLESSDYHGHDNSYSYICCQPLASIEVKDNTVYQQWPDGRQQADTITKPNQLV
jgi:anthranilate synthase component I